VVRAGLEIEVEGGAAGVLASLFDGKNLRVLPAVVSVKAFAGD